MRKFVSISCLLLLCSSWAATAHAQQANAPASAAPDTVVVDVSNNEPAVPQNLPAVALNKENNQPAAPRYDFKIDLYGAGAPVLGSDEMAAARALRQYDESMRTWTLPPETVNQILAESRTAESAQDRFRLNRRDDFYGPAYRPTYDINGANRELEWNRQRFADRVADAIYPGFGRIETKYANGATSRLDYIYTRRCGGRGGLGVCWQYRF